MEDVQDNPRSGLPSQSQTGNIIKKVQQQLLQKCHLSLQMIMDELDINNDTVQKIVTEDLKQGKFACD
jgi:hypothetical protein